MKKIILGTIGCLLTLPVCAGLYDVSGIAVNVEAENAVRAKERALTDAVLQAFPKLIEKIGLDDKFVVQIDMPKPPEEAQEDSQETVGEGVPSGEVQPEAIETPENGVVITPDEISALVAGVSVANEKNTPVRYIADVTVQFKPKEINAYLTERGVPFLDKEPPKMVIIPIVRENGRALVFEEDSPLFLSLKQTPPETNLHTFIIPDGDEFDKASITPEVLNGTDYTALDTLRAKYRAKMALIVDITKTNNVYTVKTIGYPANPSAGSDITFAVSSRATNIPAVMTHIMKKTADYLVRQLKAYHLNHDAAGGKITAVFNVSSLSEWHAIEKRLKAFNFVDKTDVKVLYKNSVFTELTFSENTQTALDKMAVAGFMLEPQSDMYVWKK